MPTSIGYQHGLQKPLGPVSGAKYPLVGADGFIGAYDPVAAAQDEYVASGLNVVAEAGGGRSVQVPRVALARG
jgi:hypothetical protein